jgi:nucleoside-diphosphate-sugar epimerase
MKKILITGANGFVGGHLCLRLARCGWDVHAAVRAGKTYRELAEHSTVHPVGDIASEAEWNRLLPAADVVVHLAARVHIIKETAPNASAEYHRINTTGTAMLARAAAQHGVAHFVYLSTVKVHGEHNLSGPYSESDTPAPCDPYSASKWDAERALAAIAADTPMAVTSLRPPLIYGPGVKGNFLRLMNLVYRRAPLPLASVNNSRSLLYVGNLVSAVEKLLAAPAAGTNTFLVSDDRDISTPQLVSMIAAALGVETRLFRCPLPMLLALGKIAGKGGEITRMVESLSLDCSHIKRQLQWAPPFTIEQGLEDTARWFLDAHK